MFVGNINGMLEGEELTREVLLEFFSAWVVEHAGLHRLLEIPNRPNNPRTGFGGKRLFFGFLNFGDPEDNPSAAEH